jgi:hypothetical protein
MYGLETMFSVKPKSTAPHDTACCGHCASTIDVKKGFCRDCRTYSFRDMDRPLGNFNFKRTTAMLESGYRFCTDHCSSTMKPLSDFDEGKRKCRKCLEGRKRRRQKSKRKAEKSAEVEQVAFNSVEFPHQTLGGPIAWSFYEEIWGI